MTIGEEPFLDGFIVERPIGSIYTQNQIIPAFSQFLSAPFLSGMILCHGLFLELLPIASVPAFLDTCLAAAKGDNYP